MITATCLLNRCPTKRLKEKVLEEVWSGRKPLVSYLRIFGSLCYKHIPDAKRRKLEDKSEPMILIGHHVIGAYRLYNPHKQKVEINRDVYFTEAEAGTGADKGVKSDQ